MFNFSLFWAVDYHFPTFADRKGWAAIIGTIVFIIVVLAVGCAFRYPPDYGDITPIDWKKETDDAINGTEAKRDCSFPFKFHGKTYDNCTTDGKDGTQSW